MKEKFLIKIVYKRCEFQKKKILSNIIYLQSIKHIIQDVIVIQV